MVFTTLTYFVFVTVVFTIYWSIRLRTAQNIFLILASFIFYAWWDYRFISLIFLSSVVDFIVGIGLSQTEKQFTRKCLLFSSIIINLSILCIFKYFGFFLDSLIALLTFLKLPSPNCIDLQIVLPIGISFYTLQTMSYTIDVYQKKIHATSDFVAYLAYVSFFPQLVAGPIERAGNLLSQISENRTFDTAVATDGIRRILWGIAKKTIIANNISQLVDSCYAAPETVSGNALLLATFFFSIQIYCDFSGYSDIAIGTASLFGIKLMENFRYPYFSTRIDEFWRRWHISLSTWFRDYVYIPLGGNRYGLWRRQISVVAAFLLSGLWHGASWHFVVWGLICVIPLSIRRLPGMGRPSVQMDSITQHSGTRLFFSVIKVLKTYAYNCFSWIFFRAVSTEDAIRIISRIISGSPGSKPIMELTSHLHVKLLSVVAFFVIEFSNQTKLHPLERLSWPTPVRWVAYTVFLWLIISVGIKETETFIYFQF